MLLASEAIESRAIQTGRDAVLAIERHAPDVVLLIGLPEISGVEVLKLIHDRWPDLRVVLMTGHYDRGNLDSVLALRTSDFCRSHIRRCRAALEIVEW